MSRYSNGPEAFPAPPGRQTVLTHAAQRVSPNPERLSSNDSRKSA
jgi:hypothetical protein